MNGISIIITAYNTKKYIKETLDSISQQDYFRSHDNFEILLGIDADSELLEYVKSICKIDEESIKTAMDVKIDRLLDRITENGSSV